MNACTDHQQLIALVASGAAEEGDRLRLEAHMDTCDACRTEWEGLTSLLSRTQHREDPGDAFWASYEARLMDRMSAEEEAARPALRLAIPRNRVPAGAWQMAAAIALVAIGVFLGRSSLFDTTDAPAVSAPSTELVELDERAWTYLDRSRTLLLGVANFNTGEDDPADLQLARRQSIAAELVREAPELQQALSASDRQRLSALIADLELILLQLAHLDEEIDLPQLEMVQQGVNQKAILFKIDVEAMSRRDPQTESNTGNDASPDAIRSAI